MMYLGVVFFMYFFVRVCLEFVETLRSRGYSFHQIWKILALIFLNTFFLSTLLFLLFRGLQLHIKLSRLNFLHSSLMLHDFFNSLFFLCFILDSFYFDIFKVTNLFLQCLICY